MTSTVDDPLEIEQDGPVRWLWLNRPRRRNALDESLVAALGDAIVASERDAATSAIVLAGRGPSFCAGADLSTLLAFADAGRSPMEFLTQLSSTFSRIEASPLPVVAAIHGHAVAGGMELALVADVVVAADTALIGDGHVRNGLVPAGGSSVRLPRKLGVSAARWLLLTGQLVRATALERTGWLHAVTPYEQLWTTVGQVASQLAECGGVAQARIKPLLAATELGSLELALQQELDAFAAHWSKDAPADRLREFLDGHHPHSLVGDVSP